MATHESNQQSASKPAADAGTAGTAKDFLAAFQRVESEIVALEESELVLVNLDVPSAVATALGARHKILDYREEMAELRGVDVSKLDKLRDYGYALLHTQTEYHAASGKDETLGELVDELQDIREQLFADAQGLARRGLLDREEVAKLRSGLGHKNLAMDVNGLVRAFREEAGALLGKSPVTREELDNAAELAARVIEEVGAKEQAPAVTAEATLLRQRAFTLFTRAYDEARRAVSFLRWNEGDADSIAPSLWAGRGGRGKPEPKVPASETPAEAGAGTGTAVAAPVAAPAATGAAVPVGFPGSSPFTH
jgi:hypothetical protein